MAARCLFVLFVGILFVDSSIEVSAMQKGNKNFRQCSIFEYTAKKDDTKPVCYESILSAPSVLIKCLGDDDKEPSILVDVHSADKVLREKKEIGSRSFSMKLDKSNQKKYCLGWYDISTLENYTCPSNSVVTPSQQHCPQCSSMISFNPALYFNPQAMSAKQLDYAQEPHIVYLAHFGGKTIKVGTANCRRILMRWREQGARATAVIAKCEDAFSAVNLESQISKIFSIPQAVTKKEKMNLLLNNAYIFSNSKNDLLSLHKRLNDSGKVQVLDEISVVDIDPYYFGSQGENNRWRATVDQSGNLSGECVACIGSIMAMRRGGIVYLTEMSEFYGRVFR